MGGPGGERERERWRQSKRKQEDGRRAGSRKGRKPQEAGRAEPPGGPWVQPDFLFISGMFVT